MPPSNRKPFPDKAHEDIAGWVEDNFAALETAKADIGDSLLLTDTLFELVDSANTGIGTGQADMGDALLLIDVLFGLLDQVVARVEALE